MRDTTFSFFGRLRNEPLFGVGTPWLAVVAAVGPGEAGSKARQRIVEMYSRDVFNFAFALSRCRETAKEISQDFAVEFLEAKIYTGLDEQKGGFRAFVKEWTRNRVRAIWQKRSRSRERSDERADAPSRGKSPEEQFDLEVVISRVNKALRMTREDLKAPDDVAWRAFRLWHFDRDVRRPMTQAQAAKLIGISLSWFKTVLKSVQTAFLRNLLYLLGKEEATAEQIEEEFAATWELLEGPLARYWMLPRDEFDATYGPQPGPRST